MRIIRTLFISVSMLFSPLCLAGAWGIGSFENDSALDWSYELEHSIGSVALQGAFRSVQVGGYIEVNACSAAMAAAEVVAAIKMKSFEQLPDSVRKWAISNSSVVNDALIQNAKKSVAVCSNAENSELAQLWLESSSKEWADYISTLSSKL
ncbi:DUF4259 domain-containing protein [Kistimonas asteriae]|uniref:DUF4259 domain-containing protein n=1 Tax=Kistimonas asteriae TaxID=517724 RepID=UPI001BA67805|nr:DUF4259 domain-containing protein [Kistimonas asteriae]